MSSRAIATLVLKIAGIYCIITSIPWLGHAINSWLSFKLYNPDDVQSWTLALGTLISCTILLALGGLLFFNAERLAPLLINLKKEARGEGLSGPDLQAIIFSGVGVLVLGRSLPDLVQHVAQTFIFEKLSSGYYLGPLLQVGIGLGLFLGARGLAHFWHWLRTAGLSPAD